MNGVPLWAFGLVLMAFAPFAVRSYAAALRKRLDVNTQRARERAKEMRAKGLGKAHEANESGDVAPIEADK